MKSTWPTSSSTSLGLAFHTTHLHAPLPYTTELAASGPIVRTPTTPPPSLSTVPFSFPPSFYFLPSAPYSKNSYLLIFSSHSTSKSTPCYPNPVSNPKKTHSPTQGTKQIWTTRDIFIQHQRCWSRYTQPWSHWAHHPSMKKDVIYSQCSECHKGAFRLIERGKEKRKRRITGISTAWEPA